MNVIRKAAQSLPGHWYKGSYGNGRGKMCAAGHIMLAQGFTEEEVVSGKADDRNMDAFNVFEFVNNVVREFTNGRFEFVADFNDDDRTTEEDVVALLEKAAVRWDERI